MVCSTAILTSSLALSLLRNSSPPNESFVFSPFSLNTALSIVHDGAGGYTQTELTDLLLRGCSPSDVTELYSSLAHSLPTTDSTGVAFKSANQFILNDTISLKNDYQKHIEEKYNGKVKTMNFNNKIEVANAINKYVEEATNGKIKEVLKTEEIKEDPLAYLINAVHMIGKWKHPFESYATHAGPFEGLHGRRTIDFMSQGDNFLVNLENDIGTVLIMPYQDEIYNFFFLMPNKSSSLETMRKELTGEKLLSVLKSAKDEYLDVEVPKFKVESKVDGVEVLKKLGIVTLFENEADLSKISATPLKVSKILHNAINEEGTEAAASTVVEFMEGGMMNINVREFKIDRPFLFGILRNDDILFLGQFV